MISSTN